MVNIYNTDIDSGKLNKVKEIEKGAWINLVHPSESEINNICSELNISDNFIKYALDYDEQARIDQEEDTILFILDVPIIEKNGNTDATQYTTMPLGIIIVRDFAIITVSLKENIVINQFVNEKIKNFHTYKKTRFLFQMMYYNASCFLTYLKRINKETEVAESVLKASMKNKELLKLLSLEKSLVYFTTSLKSNELVMEKSAKGKILKLYEEDEDLIEDAIIENQQAIEMSQIYSNILNGTMDAYSSIISNNLNGVMKLLTSLTIILSIPTMIASFWGMNVPVPFQNNIFGFWITCGIAIILTLIITWILKIKHLLS